MKKPKSTKSSNVNTASLGLTNREIFHVEKLFALTSTPELFSISETYIYCFADSTLRIYNKEFAFIKVIGQNTIPTGAFYIPADITQFECKNGKYFLLNKTNFQILGENNGELIKTIQLTADNFVFDSKDMIVLLNKAKKELTCYNDKGDIIESIPIENYRDGLTLKSLSKNDEPIFFDIATRILTVI